MKTIIMTEQEYDALLKYFDNTEINISRMIRNEGLKTTKDFESALEKIYAATKTEA